MKIFVSENGTTLTEKKGSNFPELINKRNYQNLPCIQIHILCRICNVCIMFVTSVKNTLAITSILELKY